MRIYFRIIRRINKKSKKKIDSNNHHTTLHSTEKINFNYFHKNFFSQQILLNSYGIMQMQQPYALLRVN